MGLSFGKSKDDKVSHQRKVDKDLDKKLKDKVADDVKSRKVLLLGPGESGKSTFLRQMVISHRGGFNDEEKSFAASKIRQNLIEGMKEMVRYVKTELSKPENGGLELSDESKSALEGLMEMDPIRQWKDHDVVKEQIETLWRDPAIQVAWTRRSDIVFLNENFGHFVERLDVIAKPGYCPSNDDILLMRVRTAGINRETFDMGSMTLEMIDVGGQKNERRKWISLFSEVDSILFLVAVSEYDQRVYEDEKVNRMLDALDVFNDIVNNPLMKDIPICFFFNKSDLFEKKFKEVSLKVCFPDWDEANDGNLSAAYTFLAAKFKALCKFKDKQISFFQTTATSADNVRAIWSELQLQLLNKNLSALMD